MAQQISATADIMAAAAQWRIWTRLAWHDIQLRYRRTSLGPLWMTANNALSVLGLGLLFSTIFQQDMGIFFPFLSAGLAVWTLINTAVSEGGSLFLGAKDIIQSLPLPVSLHVFRAAMRGLLVFAHNILVFIVLAVAFKVEVTFAMLLVIPGLLLVFANCIWIGILLGITGARYRDIPQIVTAAMGLIYFLTPVFWDKALLREHHWLADLNPFYHLLEVVRAPLLGSAPTPLSYAVCCILLIGGFSAAQTFLVRFRGRLMYWL